MSRFAAVLLVGVVMISACATAPEQREGGTTGGGAIVQTDSGPVRGAVHDGYRSFWGIPYAAPPVGALRWRSPRPPQPWTSPRDATRAGSRCPQLANALSSAQGGGEEDCLFLNVTTPDSASVDRVKPVMVYLHATGPSDGAGSDFDPHRLAVDGDVVVVTLNFRLGILGNFGLPGLAGSGGFGLEDQQAAVRWVQRNATAFGGDPGNVTLFGYSGGGFAVCAQLTSPPAAGLFHRAIIQSAPCPISYPAGALEGITEAVPSVWRSPQELEALGSAVAAGLGCADPATALECLRALPAARLIEQNQVYSSMGYGAPVLPSDPVTVLREGRFHPVPVISGATRDEMRFFVAFQALVGQPVTPDGYPQLLREAFGEAADQVAARYPLDGYPSPGLAWATVLSDRVYAHPTFAQNRALASLVPTYAYEFADPRAPALTFPFPPDLPGGAFHGSDMLSVLDSTGAAEQAGQAPDQQRLSDQLVRYWANFALTGDPNGPGLPPWPPFDALSPSPSVQSLAPGAIRPVDLVAARNLDLWDTLGGRAG